MHLLSASEFLRQFLSSLLLHFDLVLGDFQDLNEILLLPPGLLLNGCNSLFELHV